MADSNLSQTRLSEEFIKDFSLKKQVLTGRISGLSNDCEAVNEQLSEISSEIQLMSKSLHDAAMFLPSYSIKIRQNEIRELEQLLKEKEDALVPKKKFGFKSKLRPVPVKDVQPEPILSHNAKTRDINVTNMANNYFTIEGKKHETVYYTEKDLNNNDVLVKDLENCIVVLTGGPSTLRLASLKNCKILCGPVRTSIFVDNVFDSNLYLCCQQLRTHSSERLDIYLKVASRAIIEDCTKIRFGPYIWDHEKSGELHKTAEIDVNLERYDAVDDFNWLSATQSPNWEIIPDAERKPFGVD